MDQAPFHCCTSSHPCLSCALLVVDRPPLTRRTTAAEVEQESVAGLGRKC